MDTYQKIASRTGPEDCNRPRTPSKRIQKMVLDGPLITTGRGVRGDPLRYFANPAHIAKQSNMPEELSDVLDTPVTNPLRTRH
jgi:hypothetical protein